MLSASSENYLKGSEAVIIPQVAKEHLMFLQHILINLSFNFSNHTRLMVAILDSTALSVKFAFNDCIMFLGPSGCCHCLVSFSLSLYPTALWQREPGQLLP